ncbi:MULTISPECIES: PspC domain-containing protein [unclassified Fusibacter]|uniref:PspC domain-containing protein n=1 Tax=unclassified Fusibacter TaxID=2624464 RepID=UPI001012B8C0|nr:MULTISPECIES: PspC domain-containing protein [unclassified Fusibacter]MCK8058329.1 PspC domain-containing protein [Fusibacter sp. A2]NPE20912.1 PspC domain-containing protein [Fusibacter sp. A1]RXV63115.1 PspC domain-containing protein [Fusibacter sp. A1]
MSSKKLYRSRHDKMIGGVCAGLANYLGIDTSIVRILVFIAVFFGGLSVWLYIAAMIFIPLEPSDPYYDVPIVEEKEEIDDEW